MKKQHSRTPSLLRKVIDAYYERMLTHRALRLLSKQMWSVEFLTALLVRASKVTNSDLEMVISNGTQQLIVRSTDTTQYDDNIFNHLDDEVKVRAFIDRIRQHA